MRLSEIQNKELQDKISDLEYRLQQYEDDFIGPKYNPYLSGNFIGPAYDPNLIKKK